MGQGLDVGVRADPAAAAGAITLLEHLAAGVDSADDAAHGDDDNAGLSWERRFLCGSKGEGGEGAGQEEERHEECRPSR